MKIVIDTGVLGIMCHDARVEHGALMTWVNAVVATPGAEVFIAAISDYELRRKLVHLAMQRGLPMNTLAERLDALCIAFTFLPLTETALRHAANLWARARHEGLPTAAPDRLDADVILAAQALEIGASVVTDNVKHLERFCPAHGWRARP